ncbi:MAG: tetratricopeptide repeat protein [Treponema sp.]|jgi:tetratricopeptide (TPR) repeat protein|nr:tetratricopeptide repeat protein [Treponema sp.]
MIAKKVRCIGHCVWLTLFACAFVACSSVPKRPAELFTIRNAAETQLDLANHEVDQGNFERALHMLDEAKRLATSVDDPSLLVRELLARGNVLYYQGDESGAALLWEDARAEAEHTGEIELAAMARIYQERGRLLSGADAEEVRIAVIRELSVIRKDKLFIALGWTVIGLAEKENGHFVEAEAALKKSLDIHQQGNYLEAAGNDWYLIASVRSVAGDYDAAINALAFAIAFDRRAENPYGLGMDWRAAGDVYKKAGDRAAARNAYQRSLAIFKAISLEQEAAASEAYLTEL